MHQGHSSREPGSISEREHYLIFFTKAAAHYSPAPIFHWLSVHHRMERSRLPSSDRLTWYVEDWTLLLGQRYRHQRLGSLTSQKQVPECKMNNVAKAQTMSYLGRGEIDPLYQTQCSASDSWGTPVTQDGVSSAVTNQIISLVSSSKK